MRIFVAASVSPLLGSVAASASSAVPIYRVGEPGPFSLRSLLDHPLLISALATMLGVLVAVMTVRSLLLRDDQQGGPSERRLLRAMEISPSDRRLLRRLAHRAGLPNASCLMISRGCLEHAVASADLEPDAVRRCQSLIDRLFSEAAHTDLDA